MLSEILQGGRVPPAYQEWVKKWQSRYLEDDKSNEERLLLLSKNNPIYIPRNHRIESALKKAEEDDDFSEICILLKILSNPYASWNEYSEYRNLPSDDERVYYTFCGT